MEKFNRFVARYAVAIFWIVLICIAAVLMIIVEFGVPLILAYVLALVLPCICARWILTRDQALRSRSWAFLTEQCDPYPALKEMEVQMSYQGMKPMKLSRMMDYSTVLMEIGEYEKAYAWKNSLREDMERIKAVSAKTVYYHNMAMTCMKMSKWQEMEYWHGKMMASLQGMRSDSQRQAHYKQMEGYLAAYHYVRREYAESLRILDGMPRNSLRQEVSKAMSYARNYVDLGETEKAKEALAFVVGNGNKLYVVQEARRMLAEMEKNTLA